MAGGEGLAEVLGALQLVRGELGALASRLSRIEGRLSGPLPLPGGGQARAVRCETHAQDQDGEEDGEEEEEEEEEELSLYERAKRHLAVPGGGQARAVRCETHEQDQHGEDGEEEEGEEELSLYERAKRHLAVVARGEAPPDALATRQPSPPGPVCEAFESIASMDYEELEPSTRPRHQPSRTLRPMKSAIKGKTRLSEAEAGEEQAVMPVKKKSMHFSESLSDKIAEPSQSTSSPGQSGKSYAPTTLMGRLQAAALQQQESTQYRKPRSMMEYRKDQMAGYSVRDMQRNEYMKNHWRESMPSTSWGIFLFLLRAIFWGPYYPFARNRMRWDYIVILTTVWVCIYTPFTICFSQEVTRSSRLMLAAESIIYIVFVLDIYVNCRTVYYGSRGELVVRPVRILKCYAKTWLIVDLLAANPLGLILPLIMRERSRWLFNVLQVMQLIKLAKAGYILQLPYIMKKIEESLGWTTTKMLMLIAAAYLLLHSTACVFYLASKPYADAQMGNWVSQVDLSDKSIWHTYVAAMYWAMSTMTTVGYGDITPQHTTERLWCMVGMLVGVTAFAYFMSSMASIAAAMNSYSNRMAAQRADLDDFLQNAKIPKELANRVRRYRNYVMEREYGSHAYDIIGGLSSTLRVDVLLYLHSDILSKVPLFHDKSKQFMAYLVSFFKLEFYAPGDIIMEVDERSDEMYFIGEGRLEVYVPLKPPTKPAVTFKRRKKSNPVDDVTSPQPSMRVALKPEAEDAQQRDRVRQALRSTSKRHFDLDDSEEETMVKMGELKDGEFFGEYSCLTGTGRTATVCAAEYSEVYCLSKHDLEKMLVDWPEMATELYSLMDEFVTGLPNKEESMEPASVGATVFGVVKATTIAQRTRKRLQSQAGNMQSTLSRIERAAAEGVESLNGLVMREARRQQDEEESKKLPPSKSGRSLVHTVIENFHRGHSAPPGTLSRNVKLWRMLASGECANPNRIAPETDSFMSSTDSWPSTPPAAAQPHVPTLPLLSPGAGPATGERQSNLSHTAGTPQAKGKSPYTL